MVWLAFTVGCFLGVSFGIAIMALIYLAICEAGSDTGKGSGS